MRKIIIVLLLLCSKAEAQSSALELGNTFFEKGNYSKAIEAYEKHSDSSVVFDKIAKCYLALGSTKKAEVYYEKSYNAFPEDELTIYNYAKILLGVKQYARASELFEKLIYKDHENPNYYYQKGLALEKMKDSMQLAIDQFQIVVRKDQTHQKAIIKLGKHYLKKRKHKLVNFYVDNGLVIYPESVALISLKAQNFYWQHYYTKAAIWFEKLVAMGESTEFIHEKLSQCYADESDYKKAIANRKKVLELNPYDTTSMYVIGRYYQMMTNYEEAEQWYNKYLAAVDVPLDEEYVSLGFTLNYQKKYKEGIEALKKALKENPENFRAQFFLVSAKAAYYKDYDAKIKVYEDFLKKYPNHKLKDYAEMRLSELKKEKFIKED